MSNQRIVGANLVAPLLDANSADTTVPSGSVTGGNETYQLVMRKADTGAVVWKNADGVIPAVMLKSDVAGDSLSYASGVLNVNIDGLDALGGTGLHQTQDFFMFSDNGTEKKITFSNLQDAVFADVSGDIAIAAGGAATIQSGAVESGMLNNNVISGQTEMTGDVADADELLISDAGTIKRADFSVVRDAVFNDVSGDVAIAAGGSATIQAGAVEHGMLAEDIISGQSELAHADIQDADDLMIHDSTAGAVLKVGVDSLRDHYFGVVSGDVAIADGGAATIQAGAVEHGMLAEDIISGQSELAHADIQDADDLMIHDSTAGAVLKVGVDSLRDHFFGVVSGDAAIADGGALTIQPNAVQTGMVHDDVATELAQGAGLEAASGQMSVSAAQTSITSILNASFTKLGTEAAEEYITFGQANEVNTHIGNSKVFGVTANGVNITGAASVSSNLTVTGNLTINGTTTTVDTATLSVEDPLIALASGNDGADTVDIGLYGLYDTSGSQDLYGGLFRDADDGGTWKLFKDNQAEPTSTVNVGGTGYARADLDLGILDASGVYLTSGQFRMPDNTSGKILVADGTSFQEVAMSGDVAIVANGTTAIQAEAVHGSMLNTDAISGLNSAMTGDVADADELMISDDGTLKRVDFSVVRDAVFNDVSSDIAIAAGGAATIQANAVHGSMLNTDAISGQTEMTGDVADADELMISDAGVLKRADFSVVRDAVFNDVSGDVAIAAGGSATIQAEAVHASMLNDDAISGHSAMNSDELAAADEFLVSDGGVLKKLDASILMKDAPGLLAAGSIDVAADHIMFLDGGATADAKIESVSDLVAAMAGDGIQASAGVLSSKASRFAFNLDFNGSGQAAAAILQKASSANNITTLGGQVAGLGTDRTGTLTFDASAGDVSAFATQAAVVAGSHLCEYGDGTAGTRHAAAKLIVYSDSNYAGTSQEFVLTGRITASGSNVSIPVTRYDNDDLNGSTWKSWSLVEYCIGDLNGPAKIYLDYDGTANSMKAYLDDWRPVVGNSGTTPKYQGSDCNWSAKIFKDTATSGAAEYGMRRELEEVICPRQMRFHDDASVDTKTGNQYDGDSNGNTHAGRRFQQFFDLDLDSANNAVKIGYVLELRRA